MLTYLLYQNGKGYALTYENFPLLEDSLPFTVEGARGEGVLYLSGMAIPTLKGVGAIPVQALRQGANSLTYREGDTRFSLPPLQRCGNAVYVKPMKTGELLSLFLSFANATDRTLSGLEKRVSKAEQQIVGYPLFQQ
jgi:hypothetical protein